MNPATAFARVLVDELVRGGVTDAVLAPGSRNAPIALALHDADAAGRLRLHVRIDERTGGFLALGLARGSGRPVPVVCTSGTATANLHPAVLEAHHDGVPLLVLTADRPPELRGTDANQVIDQVGLYGAAVRLQHDLATPESRPGQVGYWRSTVCRALAAATDPAATGPVHLNLPLREPLLPDGDPDWPESLAGRPDGAPWTAYRRTRPAAGTSDRSDAARTLVVVAVGETVPDWAADGSVPVIAETAGAGHPAAVLTTGAWLLGDPGFAAAHRPDRVVCVGRPTLFRQVRRLVGDPAVRVEVVSRLALPGLAPQVAAVGPTSAPPARPDPAWQQAWAAADARARVAIDGVLDESGDEGGDEVRAGAQRGLRLARDLVAALPTDALLVLGSSQPVRDIGLAAPTRPDLRVLANRGVAGIDGTVSTAIGAALGDPAGRPAYALLGDLTFLHDTTGLMLGPAEPRPDLAVIVANNDGGAIFALLEQGAAEHAGSFERVFGTPVGVDLAALCAATRTGHRRVTAPDGLAGALAGAGLRVVEVPVARADIRDQHAAVRAAVAAAL